MKKILLLSAVLIAAISMNATIHNVSTSGTTYTPDVVNASVGDTVSFTIPSNHPTGEVAEGDWNTNTNNLMSGGFGPFSSDFQIILTEDMVPVIYYICTNHIGSGMKGLINVTSTINVDEYNELPEIIVGANPITNNQLNFSFGNSEFSGLLNIYSLTGKLVQTMNFNGKQGILDLNLSSGTYILIIANTNGSAIKTKRILIQ